MKSIRLLTMAAVLGFAIGAQAVAINGGITVTGGVRGKEKGQEVNPALQAIVSV